jgi:hypothetical protein
MPVRRFRDLDEMKSESWREPGDPRLWQAIEAVWKFAAATCPLRFPPGVYRHRTIEEMQRQREIWEEANFRELWRRRGIDPENLPARRP